MRIIKVGEIPNPEIEKTCSKCKTIFTYVKADVHADARDGNYVICPVCNDFISA